MENIYVGLDIGTTKVCAIVASLGPNQEINILGIGKSKSDGLTRGVITHIDRTIASIRAAVADAEAQSGTKIASVVAGIAGDHVQSFQSRGVVAISGAEQEITQADVNRLIEDTKKIALPSDRKIIHVIPQAFIVDGQDGVTDPVGMSACGWRRVFISSQDLFLQRRTSLNAFSVPASVSAISCWSRLHRAKRCSTKKRRKSALP